MPAMPTDLDWCTFGEALIGDFVESLKLAEKYNYDGLED